MEINTYCIPTGKRDEVEKLIARYQKKAARYGTTLEATFGEPYIKKVAVYENDYIKQEYVHIGDYHYEVCDLEIKSEIIKQNGWEVVAMIEHLDGGNIVTMTDEIKPEWLTMPPYCEHCQANHGLRKTLIVRHESGAEKQVGKTCLKEFCGLNPQAIGWANNLADSIEAYDVEHFDFHASGLPRAINVSYVLPLAVAVYKKQGYINSDYGKTSNRHQVFEMMNGGVNVSEEMTAEANELAEAIKAMSFEEASDALLGNVKSLVESGYCKASHIGFLAYAPKAYEDYLDRKKRQMTRKAELEADRQNSEFVGEVGKRMTFKVKDFKHITSWETQYGITHLYKFYDMDDNVLMWFSSGGAFGKCNEKGEFELYEPESVHEIAATVKAHNERDGVKQTILTRVKVKG